MSTDPAPRPRNIASLTVARGLLALWVVLHHYWGDTLDFFPGLIRLDPFVQRGNLAVLGFFILSGCVIALNYGHWFPSFRIPVSRYMGFMLQRLARLYPVHLVTLLSVAVLVWASYRVGVPSEARHYQAVDFVWNLLLVHAWGPNMDMTWNFPSWSISAEWLVYLAFPFFAAAFHRWVNTSRAALVVGGVALLSTILHVQFWRLSPFQAILLVVPNFLLGMAIHEFGKRSSELSFPKWMPDFLFGLVVLACFVPDLRISVLLLSTVPALGILVLLVNGNRTTAIWKSAPLVLLGEISYSLYLTHAVVEKPLHKLMPAAAWAQKGTLGSIAGAATYVLVVGLGAWGCYLLVERPMREHLGGYLKRRAANRV